MIQKVMKSYILYMSSCLVERVRHHQPHTTTSDHYCIVCHLFIIWDHFSCIFSLYAMLQVYDKFKIQDCALLIAHLHPLYFDTTNIITATTITSQQTLLAAYCYPQPRVDRCITKFMTIDFCVLVHGYCKCWR